MALPVSKSLNPKDNLPVWAGTMIALITAVVTAITTLSAGWPWYGVLILVCVIIVVGAGVFVAVQGHVTPVYKGTEPAVPVPPHPDA